jgi:serine/threonine protein kinase
MSAAAPAPDLLGQTIDGLAVRALLGRGGMAEVYKAWDPKLERFVALKIVSEEDARDRDFALRFEREARAASDLSHPNIAHIYGTGRHRGRPFYVMEFVEGRSLAEVLDAEGRLTGLRGVDYLRQAAEGLRAAYDKGIVHRDIKPDNLMIGASGVLKIVDFGLARRIGGDVRVTQTSVVVGTPRYMSPEQATAGPLDHRSDIYSLGACFYHLFAGDPPFDASTPVALMMKHVGEPLTPLKVRAPSVPSGVATIVERMLAKKPEDRYQTYDELLRDVDAARAGRMKTAAIAPPPARIARAADTATSANPWLFPAVLVVALLAALVVFGISSGASKLESAAKTLASSAAPAASPQSSSSAGPPLQFPASWNAPGMINMALKAKTLAHLRKLATSCQVWMSEHGEMPESLEPVVAQFEVPPQEQRDGWARLIRYEKTSRSKFRLSSDGPDGRPGTEDDIVMENGFVTQGEMEIPGVPTSRQQRGLDPPPPAQAAEPDVYPTPGGQQ